MGYLRAVALRPIAARIPDAKGRGVHADELDSSFDAIAPLLSPSAYRRLEGEAREEIRSNPEALGSYEGEAKGDAVLGFAWLYKVAMLVTGVWGQYRPRQFDEPKIDVPASMLARKNPSGVTYPSKPGKLFGPRGEFRDFDPFFARMSELKKTLRAMISHAEEGYRRLRRQKTPWVEQGERMLSAVEFVLAQEKVIRAGRVASIFDESGLPFGMAWGVLAAKGNKKLPFVAYSELPMSTCPGAGACGVYSASSTGGPNGYCYSFKAWRYPAAFARQFLNTLANYADREFAIYAATGGKGIPDADDESNHSARIDAAVAGSMLPQARLWQQWVKGLILQKLSRRIYSKDGSRSVFVRLFVDGDIGTEDNIISWMEVCKDLDVGGKDYADIMAEAASRGVRSPARILFYGYTKSWAQFVNVGKAGYRWPANYAVNMSNNSIYQMDAAPSQALSSPAYAAALASYQITSAMKALPVTRGYFDAINMKNYVKEFESADLGSIRRPTERIVPFDWDDKRVIDFIKVSRVKNVDEAREVLGLPVGDPFKVRVKKTASERDIELAVKRAALGAYLTRIANSPTVGRAIRTELARDAGFSSSSEYKKAQQERWESAVERRWSEAKAEAAKKKISVSKASWIEGKYAGKISVKPPKMGEFSKKAVQEKALSLLVHEALFAVRGSGAGSCPLVCGNCSDRPFGDPAGVHRCASMKPPPDGFGGVHIHIGLH